MYFLDRNLTHMLVYVVVTCACTENLFLCPLLTETHLFTQLYDCDELWIPGSCHTLIPFLERKETCQL